MQFFPGLLASGMQRWKDKVWATLREGSSSPRTCVQCRKQRKTNVSQCWAHMGITFSTRTHLLQIKDRVCTFRCWQIKVDCHATDRVKWWFCISVSAAMLFFFLFRPQIKLSRFQTISFDWIIHHPPLKDHRGGGMVSLPAPLLRTLQVIFCVCFKQMLDSVNQTGR